MTEPSNNGASGGALPVLVSVVIPAYKCADYIDATLKSVLAQSFTGYEIIVVNDGSPDTEALEQRLAPYFSSIRYIKQENAGPSSARNRGMQEAHGKYVAFLDSDDLWLPNHLANQVKKVQEDPSVVLVYADSLLLRDDTPFATAFERCQQQPPVNFESIILERCVVGTTTTMVLRQAAIDSGGFEVGRHRSEDFDLWARMAHRGGTMTYSTEVQACHRVANGLSCDNTAMKRAQMDVYEKFVKSLPLTPEQSIMLRAKMDQTKTRIQIAIAKDSLLREQFPEALAAVREANSTLRSPKLSVATAGLKLFPRFFGRSYRAYLQYFQQREAARLARFHNAQEIQQSQGSDKVGYEAYARVVSEARLWAKAGK